MTPFRKWEIGKLFEVMEDSKARFGVKVSEHEALFFDTYTTEPVNHNKSVSDVRDIHRGRLARTHDNRLVVVEEIIKGSYAGYYVHLTGRQDFVSSEITLIPVGTGKRPEEVDITLVKLKKVREKERILFNLLEKELVD